MARSITFFFVWFSFHSLAMTKNTEAKDEEHRKKLEDLVQGFDRVDSASLGILFHFGVSVLQILWQVLQIEMKDAILPWKVCGVPSRGLINLGS